MTMLEKVEIRQMVDKMSMSDDPNQRARMAENIKSEIDESEARLRDREDRLALCLNDWQRWWENFSDTRGPIYTQSQAALREFAEAYENRAD